MDNMFWTETDRHGLINNQVCFDYSYTKILENGKKFHRIVAIQDFEAMGRRIKKGQLGGWLENKAKDAFFRLRKFWIDYTSLVESGTELVDSFIGKDVIIRSRSIITNCYISDGVRIVNSEESSCLANSRIRGKMFIDSSTIRDSFIKSGVYSHKSFYISNCGITVGSYIRSYHRKVYLSNCSMIGVRYGYEFDDHEELNEEDLIATKSQKFMFQRIYGNYDNNIVKSLYAQTGLMPINHKIYAYKTVNKDMSSIYDKDFIYKVGEVMQANNICEDENVVCGGGLHFSTANYFREYNPDLYVTLYAEIDIDDVIAVCDGKIRCRKAKILGICDNEI